MAESTVVREINDYLPMRQARHVMRYNSKLEGDSHYTNAIRSDRWP